MYVYGFIMKTNLAPILSQMIQMLECTQHYSFFFSFLSLKSIPGKQKKVLNSFLPENNPAVSFLCSQKKKKNYPSNVGPNMNVGILEWEKRKPLPTPFPLQIVPFWNTAWLLAVSFLFCYHRADVYIWDDNSEQGAIIHRQLISAGEARFTLSVKGGKGAPILPQNYHLKES